MPRKRHDDLKVLADQITIEMDTKPSPDPGQAGRKTRGSIEKAAKRLGHRRESEAGETSKRDPGPC